MQIYDKTYDVIVVGAGHAGCEAALAAARMGCSVLLLVIDLDKIASMPCSPSIGGMAKGQLVKEIDALGGEMARITDQTAIHFTTLNTRKGPAVHSTRTQNDKARYHTAMKLAVESQENIDVRQILVDRLIIENNRATGVIGQTGYGFSGKTVILATGTFLAGRVHIGDKTFCAGRAGEFSSEGLSVHLKSLGFETARLKTGTPPRLHRDSIDFSKFTRKDGDLPAKPFSRFTDRFALPQVPSYMGRTNSKTIAIVAENLQHSALYGGHITGISARYCPSFEDKVVRFPDRDRHPVILEAEGLDTREIYASGLGNSLPIDMQIDLVRTVDGLESAEIMRPAYAIEYDYFNPRGLRPTLETKTIGDLFFAGQINGTSGYEEAAAQGLWAGINAACKVQKRPPFILDRSQAYMGVMIDDLITRGTREPYRMFTSRAEYRLILREDNADIRLMETGYDLGLVEKSAVEALRRRKYWITEEIKRIKNTALSPSASLNAYLEDHASPSVDTGVSADRLLKRTEINYDLIHQFAPSETPLEKQVIRQVEIEVKYEGYIFKQLKEIEKFKKLEEISIPGGFDFKAVCGLSNELKEKLSDLRPESLGRASRIDGMTPAALSVMMVALKAAENPSSK